MGSHLSKRRQNRHHRRAEKEDTTRDDEESVSSCGDDELSERTRNRHNQDQRRRLSYGMRQRSYSSPHQWIRHHLAVPPLTAANSMQERRMRRAIIDLQMRDITPEDYSLLCALDEQNSRKTISCVDSIFQTHLASSDDVTFDCAVCLEPLSESPIDEQPHKDIELIKLPHCKHRYHAICIRKWLKEYSTKCPTCGHNYEALKEGLKKKN